MNPINVYASSQAEIVVDFHCSPCNITVKPLYPILVLREWAENQDKKEQPKDSLLQANLEKVNDANFLKSMRIAP